MNQMATIALAGMLLVGTVACNGSSTDKTSANAPDTTANTSASPSSTGSNTGSPSSTSASPPTGANSVNTTTGSGTSASPTVGVVKDNKDDATSKVRREQLNSRHSRSRTAQ